jgi:hypothetical protein
LVATAREQAQLASAEEQYQSNTFGFGLSLYGKALGGRPPHSLLLGAFIEYGAVEKFSGANSIGFRYQIAFGNKRPLVDKDPAIFNKLQVRLLKRTKDVYNTVGLPPLTKVINQLDGILGDPPTFTFPGFADWTFREIFALSGLTATNGSFSVRGLANFVIQTQPFDTPYTNPSTTPTISLRELLTNLAN